MTAREKGILAALLLAALAVRVALVLSLREAPYFHDPIVDGAAYDRWAWEIATQDFWGTRAYYQDPLYPFLLGLFYKVFGRDLLWVRLVQTALGTLGLWMLFEAARRLSDFRTAALALAIGAFYKTLAFFDAALLKDFLGVLAVEAALLLATVERRWKWAAVGTALGIGTLVRGNLLLVALALAGLLALRRDWKSAALLVAGAAACILPVTVRNAVVAHDLVLTTAQLGPNLYTGNNPENTSGRYRPPSFLQAGATEFEEPGFRDEAERRLGRPLKASEIDAFWRGEALSYIGSHFGTFLAVTGKRLLMLLNAYEVPDDLDPGFMARFSWVLRLPLLTFGLFTLPLAAAGIYLAWQERRRFEIPLLLLAAYVASILPFFVFARYRLPLVPVLILFAAHAISKSAVLLRVGMRAVPRSAGAVFAVALLAVNVPLPASIGGHRDARTAHYNLGLYRRAQGRSAEAAEELLAAAALQPARLEDPSFRWMLGEVCEGAGRSAEAFDHYAAAARIDRLSPEAAHKVGMIYLARGMDERAAEALRDALQRDPSYTAAWLPLAEAERRRGREDDALRILEAGGRALPRDAALRLAGAEIHVRRSRWAEALAAAEDALAIRPDDARALEIRAQALRKLGR